jgi:aminomethyltransferase
MSELKKTAFNAVHYRLGAKMVEFAGYEMPVQYGGIREEHRRVREAVGMFDVSHMGEVEVKGRDALAFIQSITINDAARLSEGRVQYSAMCYDDGGIVDDLLVYHLGDKYMLVINASNIEKDLAWMRSHVKGNVTLTDVSDTTSLLAVQGPKSLETLKKLTAADIGSLQYYHCMPGTLAGIDMLISRTGYTGELGYELYFQGTPEVAERLWSTIEDAGKEFSIGPAGLGARDTLRLEMGFCLYGNDIDQTTNPIEAGLGWITKADKGDFAGGDVIRKVKKEGPPRKLVGFMMQEPSFPRHGYTIHAGGGKTGTVTSGTHSPTLDRGIGMGYVAKEYSKPGSELGIEIRGKIVPATVVTLPFLAKK